MTRVLVVDDKVENQYYLQALLTGHGYTVERAMHGAEALVRARSNIPDLVISDLLMPVMDGYTLLRHWKSDPRLARVPFIVYTATYTEPEDERLARALGADAFILKPAEPEDFLERLRAIEAGARAGEAPRTPSSLADEPDLLKVYSQTLVRKLEEKTLLLEESNLSLQQEITERRRIAETQAAILGSLLTGLHGIDAQGRIVFMNAAAEAMLGYPAGGGIGQDSHESIHHHRADGSVYPAEECPIVQTLRDGEVRRVANEIFFRQDGTSFHVAYTCAPMRGVVGEVSGVVISFRDITEDLHTQTTLHDQAGLLANAERIARMGRWNMDLVAGRLTWSDATCELFGISPAEFRGTFEHFRSFILPEDGPAYDLVQARISPAEPLLETEYRIRRPDGAIRWMYERGEVEYDAAGRQVRRLGMVMDVTAERQARAELAQHASLLRIAGRVAQIGGWRIDLPERILTWSDEICAMHDRPLGYRPSLEEGIASFAPEARPIIEQHVHECIERGTPYDLELEKISATGRRFFVRTLGEAVRDDDGQIIRIQGAIQDITLRKRAEAALHEQAALLDKAQDAILVCDLEGRVRFWNRSAERLYGWTAAEMLGRHALDRLCPTAEGQATYSEALTTVLAQGDWTGEIDQRTKAGRTITIEGRWTLVRDDAGRPTSVLSINTDITGRKILEQQLLRAQRMESIGTLAGGIAHDLNNTLTPILMSISLLREPLSEEEREEAITAIESSARKGAEMVRQVLTFARGVEVKRTAVDVVRLVREIQTLANDTFLKSIQVRTEISPGLPAALGDPTQLHQVLLNLCVNARDAMPFGGILTIAVSAREVDAETAARHGGHPGPHVVLTVRDTGVGMDAAQLERIFDPFFTTKDPGKGTGLGLSTSLAIVRGHGGFFLVSSAPDHGSTFEVFLPAASTLADHSPAAERSAGPRGSGQLILVVEDEEAVREVTRRILTGHGYQVMLAVDGAEAVREFALHGERIAAVLTDMMMPVMDGTATIHALRAIDPRVRVVAVSGLVDRSETVLDERTLHLDKPYTAQELLRALDTVLHAP